MKQSHERYSDGTYVQTRKQAKAAYRDRQKLQRAWISDVSERLGEPKERLVTLDPNSVADVIRSLLENEK